MHHLESFSIENQEEIVVSVFFNLVSVHPLETGESFQLASQKGATTSEFLYPTTVAPPLIT